MPAMVDSAGTGRTRSRLRRSFSSLSWRALKSRTTLAKPCNSPFSSLRAVVMTLAQNCDPSFLTCQPSVPKWPSATLRLSSSGPLSPKLSVWGHFDAPEITVGVSEFEVHFEAVGLSEFEVHFECLRRYRVEI